MTVFTVTNTADGGPGSFRQALVDNNASSEFQSNTIQFVIDHGPQTLRPASPYPIVRHRVLIDGTTQPDFVNVPLITLNGASAGLGVDGLIMAAGKSQVTALVITQFSGNGISFIMNGGNYFHHNYVVSNSGNGVSVESSNNIIDGDPFQGTGPGNVVSGNGMNGIVLKGADNFLGLNFIGTTADGLAAVPNTASGVLIQGARNSIGCYCVTSSDGRGPNLISGNGGSGITIAGRGAVHNHVPANTIGVASDGVTGLGNRGDGITIDNASANEIVKDTSGNVIAANGGNGITIHGLSAIANIVDGNFIGGDPSFGPPGNAHDGILIDDGGFNFIGNAALQTFPNRIVNNGGHGIEIKGINATGNWLSANLIGTDTTEISRQRNLGNMGHGVFIWNGASGNTVGGSDNDALSPNYIVFNRLVGVQVGQDVTDNVTLNNTIRANSIHDNVQRGIRLAGYMPPNLCNATSSGPNHLQNPPALTQVIAQSDRTEFMGSLNSFPTTLFSIDFYVSPSGDPSGFGQGARWLGFVVVLTDPAPTCTASFDVTLPVTLQAGERVISSTATNRVADTSEFGNNITLAPDAPTAPVLSATGQMEVRAGPSPSVPSPSPGVNSPTPISEVLSPGADLALYGARRSATDTVFASHALAGSEQAPVEPWEFSGAYLYAATLDLVVA